MRRSQDSARTEDRLTASYGSAAPFCKALQLARRWQLDGRGGAEAGAAAPRQWRRHDAPAHVEALLLQQRDQVDARLLQQRVAAPAHHLAHQPRLSEQRRMRARLQQADALGWRVPYPLPL